MSSFLFSFLSLLSCLFLIDSYEFFVYFGHLLRYFLLLCVLHFPSLNRIFQNAEVLIFNWFSLQVFSLWLVFLAFCFRTFFLPQKHEDLFLCSRSCYCFAFHITSIILSRSIHDCNPSFFPTWISSWPYTFPTTLHGLLCPRFRLGFVGICFVT